MINSNAQVLRDIVEEIIYGTLDGYREMKAELAGVEFHPADHGAPTEEEIDDFLFHNVLLDNEEVEQLIDPGLLGFSAKEVRYTNEWLTEFKEKIESWANSRSWQSGDEPLREYSFFDTDREKLSSQRWTPDLSAPRWLESSPSYLLLALDLIDQRKSLSNLSWRDFENLIGKLLEDNGWRVIVTQASRDGGIDVIAERYDHEIGLIRSLWQAKRYSEFRKVRLHEVRELSGILDIERATKGIIVTTSKLTADALKWVQQDKYRLGYKDNVAIAQWLKKYT